MFIIAGQSRVVRHGSFNVVSDTNLTAEEWEPMLQMLHLFLSCLIDKAKDLSITLCNEHLINANSESCRHCFSVFIIVLTLLTRASGTGAIIPLTSTLFYLCHFDRISQISCCQFVYYTKYSFTNLQFSLVVFLFSTTLALHFSCYLSRNVLPFKFTLLVSTVPSFTLLLNVASFQTSLFYPLLCSDMLLTVN